MRLRDLSLVLAVISVWLAGCATTLPEAPALRPTPDGWTGANVAADDAVADRWWSAFGDPVLTRLAQDAGSADDVAVAEARLAEARAQLRSARAALRPEVGASASASRDRVDGSDQDQAQGLTTLGFTPDLNGAVGARSRAARASLQASEARLAAARIASRAEAVRLYATYREAEARAAAGDRAVAALTDSLSLASSRERAGLTSGLDPVAAGAALASARARPAAAREAAESARLGLEALLGLNPGALRAELDGPAVVPAAALPTALTAPVSVIARRPDLIAAERDLVAAGFAAEAARRDFWPTVSLEAALGARGVDPATPFNPEGALVRVGAGVAAPLFTFGRLESARDAADARRTEAALRYRQAATNALAEVERAASSGRRAEERRETLSQAALAAADQARLADSRYRAGLSPFLEVLTARRAQADAEADLATAQGDAARAYAALHTSLGAGSSN